MLLHKIILDVPASELKKVLALRQEIEGFDKEYVMYYKCTGSSSIQKWYKVKIISNVPNVGASFWQIIEPLLAINKARPLS